MRVWIYPLLLVAVACVGPKVASEERKSAVEAAAQKESGRKESGQQAPAAAAPATVPAPNNDCWWLRPGDRNLVAVWVSPRLTGQVPGGFRFVNLYYHDAGDRPGLLLHSSPVESRTSAAVSLRHGGRHFRAVPIAGKSWGQVVDRKDLDVTFEGP